MKQTLLCAPHTSSLPAPTTPAITVVEQTQRTAIASQLWMALHIPAVALQAVAIATDDSPLVVVAIEQRVQRVLHANSKARQAGIAPGMGLNAALALQADLRVCERDPARERALLERLAACMLQFSPRVSLEPPDAVLLEVKGSLRLFGGAAVLCRQIALACEDAGIAVTQALTPQALAALICARAGVGAHITDPGQLRGQLAKLPLGALRWPDDELARLANMGVHRLGELLRLPRAGFAQRFGPARLRMLDELAGKVAAPRRTFITAERFHGRVELDHELTSSAQIRLALQPLLWQLEDFLRQRQSALNQLQLRLSHRARPATSLRLTLTTTEFAAAQLDFLFGEHLARLQLPAAVTGLQLRTGPLLPMTTSSASLWRRGEHGGSADRELPAFIERLRARLGVEAVHGLCLVPEHRPEAAWRVAEPVLSPLASASVPTSYPSETSMYRRPLWLLGEPQRLDTREGRPCYGETLQLSSGPERIESGWWDGRDIARDYYLACNAAGMSLWVYRERSPPHAWYLHGVFA